MVHPSETCLCLWNVTSLWFFGKRMSLSGILHWRPIAIGSAFAFSEFFAWYESDSQKVNSGMDSFANYQWPKECGLMENVKNQKWWQTSLREIQQMMHSTSLQHTQKEMKEARAWTSSSTWEQGAQLLSPVGCVKNPSEWCLEGAFVVLSWWITLFIQMYGQAQVHYLNECAFVIETQDNGSCILKQSACNETDDRRYTFFRIFVPSAEQHSGNTQGPPQWSMCQTIMCQLLLWASTDRNPSCQAALS